MGVITIAVNLVGNDDTGSAFAGAYGRIFLLKDILQGMADTAKQAFADMVNAGGQLEMATTMASIAISDGAQHVGELQNAIMDMANTSQYQISEVDQAFRLLGERGFNTAQILQGGLGQAAINLGQAMGETAVNGADVLSQALRLMTNQHLSASQAADMLTRAFYDGMPAASDLSSYLGQVGGTANVLGISLQDVLTAGDMLTPVLGSASTAGSALNYMLRGLTSPTAAQAAEIKTLGLNVWDTQGRFMGFQSIMDQLITKFETGHFTTEQMATALGNLFNVRSGRGAMDLVGMLGQFDPTFNKIKNDINQVGTAQKDAAAINDTAQGSWKRLTTTFNDFLAKAGELVNGVLKPLYDWLNQLLSAMQKHAVIVEFAAAFITAAAALTMIVVAILGVVLVLAVLGSGIGIVILGILAVAAAIAAIVVAIMNWGNITNWLAGIWKNVQEAIGNFFSWLGTNVHTALQAAGQAIQSWAQGVGQWFASAWNGAQTAVGNFFNWLGTSVHNGLQAALSGVTQFGADLAGGFRSAVNTVVGIAQGLWQRWQDFNNWMLAHNYYWNDAAAIIQNAMNTIRNAIGVAVSWVQTQWNAAVNFLRGLWSGLVGIASSIWNSVSSTVSNAANSARVAVSNAWNQVSGATSSAWNQVSGIVSSFIGRIAGQLAGWGGQLAGQARGAWNQFTGAISGAAGAAASAAQGVMNAVLGAIGNIGGQLYQAGLNAINMLANGIRAAAGNVASAASGVAGNIASFLGFHSPTEEGPGSDADTWMPNLMRMAAGGLTSNLPMLRSAAGQVANTLNSAFGVSPQSAVGSNVQSMQAALAQAARTNAAGSNGQIVIPINIGNQQLGQFMLDLTTGKLRQAGINRMGR